MIAREFWKEVVTGKCSIRLTPFLCPGFLVFAKIMNAKTIDDASRYIMLCYECRQVQELAENPADYKVGIEAGVACKHYLKTETCKEISNVDIKRDGVPVETLKNADRVIELVTKAGYRVRDVVWDAEILHVVVSAGCGEFTVSCGPVGCQVTDATGVDVELSDAGVVARCSRKPPYLDDEYFNFF